MPNKLLTYIGLVLLILIQCSISYRVLSDKPVSLSSTSKKRSKDFAKQQESDEEQDEDDQ